MNTTHYNIIKKGANYPIDEHDDFLALVQEVIIEPAAELGFELAHYGHISDPDTTCMGVHVFILDGDSCDYAELDNRFKGEYDDYQFNLNYTAGYGTLMIYMPYTM